jgi:hypothetical protein
MSEHLTMSMVANKDDMIRLQREEIDRLRERVWWAEGSLDTWDDERDASYWQRYPEPMPSPFGPPRE